MRAMDTLRGTEPNVRRWMVLAALLVALGCSGADDARLPAGDDTQVPLDDGFDGSAKPDAAPDDDASDSLPPQGCNPLASEWDCLLPYPSDFFLVDDPSLPSGRRLAVTGAARVRRPDGRYVEPYAIHPADGFSHHPSILVRFPEGVARDNLVFHTDDVLDSLGPDSPTILLVAHSGERVPHFAEVDPRETDDPGRTLLIRPLQRLQNGTRYIAAIRGLRNLEGELIAAPEGFRRVCEGDASDDPVLGATAARFERDLFPALAALGVQRAELQLAWDFTIQTEDYVTRDMLAVRADLIARLEQAPPPVTITSVTEDVDERVLRDVKGTMQVPLYLDSDAPGARLNRDATGSVIAIGHTDVPFSLRVPRSLEGFAAGQDRARVLQYGHGFFDNRDEIEEGWIAELAERFGFVVVAVDWWGMSAQDLDAIVDAISRAPSETLLFTDRLHQAMANQIALTYAISGPLAQVAALQADGLAVFDPAQIYFYGCSQGGILGGTFAALSPQIDRAVLGVSGASFTFMMFRSRYFSAFLMLIETLAGGPFNAQKWIALLPTTFDRVDPITYQARVLRDMYPGSPAARWVLMQNGVGDSDVPNLASHLAARTLGVKLLEPAPRTIPFIDSVDAPSDGSAIVEFDFGVPEPLPGTEATLPDVSTGVHNGLRALDASMRQVDRFLRPGGRIEHTCDGICDPE